MDKEYQSINSLVDEILGVFYVVVPMYILGSVTFIFKDVILDELMTISSNIIQYSF